MTSSELLFTFAVDQLKGSRVTIVSVFSDKLLIGCYLHNQLFIFNLDGHHLSTITSDDNDELRDATWTPRGYIVYTTWISKRVVSMSESGSVLATHTTMRAPQCLSVSDDGIIYLADFYEGVYRSADDGASWNLVFNSTDGWHCWHVIKVINDLSDDYWTLEQSDDKHYELRVYSFKSIGRRRSDRYATIRRDRPDCYIIRRDRSKRYITRKTVNLPTADDKHINLCYSNLSYDGNMNIFLSDWHSAAVHVLSANGQYKNELLSLDQIKFHPARLTVDGEHELLYVGQDDCVVSMFKLT